MPGGIRLPKERWRGGDSGATTLASDHAPGILDSHEPGTLVGLVGDAGIDISDRGTLLGNGVTTGGVGSGHGNNYDGGADLSDLPAIQADRGGRVTARPNRRYGRR